MDPSIHMLSADDGSIYRLAPVLIFFAIWAIGAVASAVNKAKVKQREVAVNPPLPPVPTLPTVVNDPAPRMPQVAASRLVMPPLPTLAGKAARAKKPARTPTPPPIPQSSAPPVEPVSRPAISRSADASSSATFAAWLRPQTVRSQFALSQILGKPVALQDRPHLPSL